MLSHASPLNSAQKAATNVYLCAYRTKNVPLQFLIEVVLPILLEVPSNHSNGPQVFNESLQMVLQPL